MAIPKEKLIELMYAAHYRALSRGPVRHGLMPDSSSFSHGSSAMSFMPDSGDKQEDESFLSIHPFPEEGQVGTAGFDLRIGSLVAWSDTVADNVSEKDLLSMEHKLLEPGEKFIFEPDKDGSRVYYVASFETVKLSNDLEIMVDSKSTTGRVGCMSHGAGRTREGNLLTIIQPYAFPLMATCGKTRLSQVVVRYKETPYMGNEEILNSGEISFEGEGISLRESMTPKGLLMQFDTQRAYRAKKCDKPVDMDAKATVDWKDYFEVIEGNSSMTLDKKTLYLLGSLGVIGLGRACGILSREQEVITGTGAWGHFAGIFQPGFVGGITMEVYSHSKRRISKRDKSGVVIFDKVESTDTSLSYKEKGSYQGQRPPLLPKMFRIDK